MAEVERTEGFSWSTCVWKGVKAFALIISASAVLPILEAVSNETVIAAIFREAGAPVGVAVAGTALVAALGKMGLNWWKNRNKPV